MNFFKKNPIKPKLFIEGFDIENYLAVNSDLKRKISLPELSEKLPKEILDSIQNGSRQFHKNYEIYNEDKYLNRYNDVQEAIKNGKFDSGFEHFCLFGYQEIVMNKRAWNKMQQVATKNKISIDNTRIETKKSFEKPSYQNLEWILESSLFEDPFYAITFIQNINQEKYLKANKDVAKASESDKPSILIEHLIYHGLADILSQKRQVYDNIFLDNSIFGHVDRSVVTSKHSIFINGWFFCQNQKIHEIYLSNKTYGINLTNKINHYNRPDLIDLADSKASNAGFYCFVEDTRIDTDNLNSYGLILISDDGLSKRLPITLQKNNNRVEVSQIILGQLTINSNMQHKLDNTIGVALQNYLKSHPITIKPQDIKSIQFGQTIQEPKLSIIVPLYGRIDFVEYQLSKFANNKFLIDNVELIYLLDDPRLENELERMCHSIFPIFQVPFKLISYNQNVGYAGVNNIGVNQASSELVLLLNSDILPIDKNWIEMLIETYHSLDNPGVICPKLLFEDGAVQHAGMVFEHNKELNVWLNEHPGKGLPDIDNNNLPKEMPAVTGACMLTAKKLYQEMGGLAEEYFLGDFEDSDLCLKLAKNGYKNYYIPSIKLCHLERQSQSLFSDTSWKGKVTLYNAWQHDRKWAQDIAIIMKEYYER